MVRAAERDWEILLVIVDAPRVGLPGICFHAQQCIEKYLKALLIAYGMNYERTHNLSALARKLGDLAGKQPMDDMDYSTINPCAATLRYGDEEIETVGRDWFMAKSRQFREWARAALAQKGVEI
jgi:hypothetical protein